MEIFPYLITRIAGAPFDVIDCFEFKKLYQLFETLKILKDEKENKKNKICTDLLKYNQTLNDKSLQNAIQNIRRDIFNDRKIKTRDLVKLNEIIVETIDEYVLLVANLLNFTRYFDKKYRKIQNDYSLMLQSVAKNEFLQKGLLISSQELYKDANEYLFNSPKLLQLKRDEHLELSLFKYITRSCTKTSPFSTFTNLSNSIIQNKLKVPIFEPCKKIEEDSVISYVRINNYILKYIADLLLSIPELSLNINLSINSTVEIENKNYLFLTNCNNKEAFQRIPRNFLNKLIFLKLSTNKKATQIQLTTYIKKKINVAEDQLNLYLKSLINCGFLEYRIPISGTDPNWNKTLRKFLLKTFGKDFKCINELVQTLKNMDDYAILFQSGTSQMRNEILQKAFLEFKIACKNLHNFGQLSFTEVNLEKKNILISNKNKLESNDKNIDREFLCHKDLTFRFTPEKIYYDDTIRTASFKFKKDELEEFVQKLNNLFSCMDLSDIAFAGNEKIAEFFLTTFGERNTITLLTFYEHYSRWLLKEKEALKKNTSESISTKTRQKLDPLDDKKQASATQTYKNGENILITVDNTFYYGCDIKESDFCIQDKKNKLSYSKSFFVQFYQERQKNDNFKLVGVINGCFPGNGKLISRFLHLFDKKVTNDLKHFNQQIAENENFIFAENTDNSYFNANIHPSFCDYEIVSPSSNNDSTKRFKLSVSDLSVRYSKEKKRLELIHKNLDQEIFVYDLGLQSLYSRSKLYQLLVQFNINYNEIFALFYRQIKDVLKIRPCYDFDDIMIFPRVTFESQIIIQRKRWQVKKEKIPLKKSNNSDSEFFIILNEWRKSLLIDNEVFVKGINNIRNDDRKPQYINFLNPLCVKLFEKLASRITDSLIIEEMLPNTQQLLSVNGKKHVSEFVLQIK